MSFALHFSKIGVLTGRGGGPYKPPINDALPPPSSERQRVSDAPHDFVVVKSPVKSPGVELSAQMTRKGESFALRLFDKLK